MRPSGESQGDASLSCVLISATLATSGFAFPALVPAYEPDDGDYWVIEMFL